jgi:hypothetical protein
LGRTGQKCIFGTQISVLKNLVFLFFFFGSAGLFYSQGEIYDSIPPGDSTRKPHHVIYLELLGNSGLYSLNYEFIVVSKPRFKFFSRVGAGPLMQDRHLTQVYLAEENFCFGKDGRFIEAGLGLTMQRKWVEDCELTEKFGYDNLYFGIARLGVRFQKEERGTVFRIGITPTIYYKDRCGESFYFSFFGGISYGLVF